MTSGAFPAGQRVLGENLPALASRMGPWVGVLHPKVCGLLEDQLPWLGAMWRGFCHLCPLSSDVINAQQSNSRKQLLSCDLLALPSPGWHCGLPVALASLHLAGSATNSHSCLIKQKLQACVRLPGRSRQGSRIQGSILLCPAELPFRSEGGRAGILKSWGFSGLITHRTGIPNSCPC